MFNIRHNCGSPEDVSHVRKSVSFNNFTHIAYIELMNWRQMVLCDNNSIDQKATLPYFGVENTYLLSVFSLRFILPHVMLFNAFRFFRFGSSPTNNKIKS